MMTFNIKTAHGYLSVQPDGRFELRSEAGAWETFTIEGLVGLSGPCRYEAPLVLTPGSPTAPASPSATDPATTGRSTPGTPPAAPTTTHQGGGGVASPPVAPGTDA